MSTKTKKRPQLDDIDRKVSRLQVRRVNAELARRGA
jgi:hypothetical protein